VPATAQHRRRLTPQDHDRSRSELEAHPSRTRVTDSPDRRLLPSELPQRKSVTNLHSKMPHDSPRIGLHDRHRLARCAKRNELSILVWPDRVAVVDARDYRCGCSRTRLDGRRTELAIVARGDWSSVPDIRERRSGISHVRFMRSRGARGRRFASMPHARFGRRCGPRLRFFALVETSADICTVGLHAMSARIGPLSVYAGDS
jgi:hypothetical protein